MSEKTFVSSTGQWLMIGALIGVGIGVKEGVAPTPFGTAENIVMQAIVIVAKALVLVGVIGLARSGAAGNGRLGLCWLPTFIRAKYGRFTLI